MTTRARRPGITYVDVLIALWMIGALVAIVVPNFLLAEKRASHSEAVTNLKSLHASLMTQQTRPTTIHVPGFDPPRSNRYSYHLGPCTSYEDRSGKHAEQHWDDDCIGADTHEHSTFPNFFHPDLLKAVAWMGPANALLTADPGVSGTDSEWFYLAYAAGDLDDNPTDAADTWFVGNSDGLTYSDCPTGYVRFAAGEPVHLFSDLECN